jgi:hypothetical protein
MATRGTARALRLGARIRALLHESLRGSHAHHLSTVTGEPDKVAIGTAMPINLRWIAEANFVVGLGLGTKSISSSILVDATAELRLLHNGAYVARQAADQCDWSTGLKVLDQAASPAR